MGKLSTIEQKAVNKIVSELNNKRQKEYDWLTKSNGEIKNIMDEQRARGFKRTGKAGMVKIATIPVLIDELYTKQYGADYYKQKGFFDEHPEWKVVKNTKEI